MAEKTGEELGTTRKWEIVSNISYGIPPTSTHSGTVIFLHGLGDVGNTWIDYFKLIERDDLKFTFPTAPSMPVSVNNGHVMPSWFDIFEISENRKKEDRDGMLEAAEYLESIVSEEIRKGIPSERIVIGGISQGGVTTAMTALTTKIKLAGVIFLSSFIPLKKNLPTLMSGTNKDTPVFHAHGEKDMLIKFDWCKNTLKLLQECFSNVEFKSHEKLGHWVCEEEFQDLKLWINKVLPPISSKWGSNTIQ